MSDVAPENSFESQFGEAILAKIAAEDERAERFKWLRELAIRGCEIALQKQDPPAPNTPEWRQWQACLNVATVIET